MKKRQEVSHQSHEDAHRRSPGKPGWPICVCDAHVSQVIASIRVIRRFDHGGCQVQIGQRTLLFGQTQPVAPLHVHREPAGLDEDG